MRLLKEIPHERFKIQIFNYNGKYTLKIEIDQFEQSFKIGESDVYGVEDLERMITPELLKSSLNRFIEMRNDWGEAFNKINQKNEK